MLKGTPSHIFALASIVAATLTDGASSTMTSTIMTTPLRCDHIHMNMTTHSLRCDSFRPFVNRVNALAYSQSAVAGVGLLACGAALLVIVGKRQTRNITGRSLVGLMLSNLVYALVDIVPTNAMYSSGVLCWANIVGREWRDPDTVGKCLPTALRFFGVYSSVMYELMMVAVSVMVLKTGNSQVSKRWEGTGHIVCASVGLVACLSFYFECDSCSSAIAVGINELESLQEGCCRRQVQASAGCRPGQFDQLYQRIGESQETFHGLPGLFWGGALAPVGVALLLWIHQQRLSCTTQGDIDAAEVECQRQNAVDPLAMLDRGVGIQAALLVQLRAAITEVVKPLRPFILVIFAFAIPQIIMTTSWCGLQTQHIRDSVNNEAWSHINPETAPLPCVNIVEVVMSFRAVALAAVFFWDASHRAALWDFRTIVRKACAQTFQFCSCGVLGAGGSVHFPEDEIAGICVCPDFCVACLSRDLLETNEGSRRSASFHHADDDVKLAGANSMAMLFELDSAQAIREDSDSASVAADGPGVSPGDFADVDGGSDPSASQVPYVLMES